jgi:signal transduction histidine kinase
MSYALTALLVVQSILIVLLLVQEHRRRRAQFDMQHFYGDMTHAARLMLLGDITASVAHQVTQPLAAILNNVETAEILLARGQPSLTEVREIIADIRRDNLRATEVVRRLRTMLRKHELQLERTDINALVASVLALIRPEVMRRHIELRTALEPELPRVSGDPVQLQQVLLNLLINAMDALSCTPRTLRSLDIRTGLHDPGCIEVAISDNGHGISPEQLPKVFDPYFTTREEGLGLGLSIARSIVQAHGGTIWAENPRSGGSVFRFTLPLQAA